jgi:hypothetical protein
MRIVYFFDIVPVILLLFFQTAKVSSKEPERIVIEGESFLKEKNDFFTVKN